MLEPKEGLLTFKAEGNNTPGSLYYSRRIHWPGNVAGCQMYPSGVTIGRGLDLGGRSKDETYSKLLSSGIPSEQAKKIAAGASLTHCQASEFVRTNRISIGEITELQQLRLFEIIYPEYVKKSMDFYNKYKNSNAVNWEKLNLRLREVFIDMFFQGAMRINRVKYFDKNDKNEIILFINQNAKLREFDKNRGRVLYLKGKS